MKNFYTLIMLLLANFYGFAQVVNIPDTNFKNYLLLNFNINTNHDGEIQESEAFSFIGVIDVDNMNISDLTGINAFKHISGLKCSNNNLTELVFAHDMNFTFVECDHNNLDVLSFNINFSSHLTSLSCSNNNLTNIGFLSHLTELQFLNCSQNAFDDLDVSNNILLEHLDCGGNNLISLDVSANNQLNFIKFSNNSITYIDLDDKPYLTTIYAGNNELFSLSFTSTNPLLIPQVTTLKCQNNNLSYLYLANGENSVLTTMDATGNPDLTCIAVDNGPSANAGNGVYASWLVDATASYQTNSCGDCVISILDTNFKNYLVNNTAINTNGDTEISCLEAQNFTGTINVDNLGISDLTGIERFTSLDILSCKNNNLTTIDLTANTALTKILCQNNSLTSLNLFDSLDNSIQSINCRNNNLTTLNLQNFNDLVELNCSYNNLTSLELPIGYTPQITTLRCNNNNLTSLSINQGNYTLIDVSNNQLTSFLMSSAASSGIERLYCSNNMLTSIPIAYSTDIQTLECDNNLVTSLTLNNHPLLTTLRCQNNDLNSLNLKNGNNTIITTMNATNNPNLSCIEVDNAADAIAGTGYYGAWQKDATAGYNEDCGCIVAIPDPVFKSYLLGDFTINTNLNDEIECSEAAAYSNSFSMDGLEISDLTGIEAFVNLDQLYCPNNNISMVDLSQNTALTYLNITNNKLVGIDVSSNTALTEVYVDANQLIELDLSNNPAITTLYCSNNNLMGLNLKNGNNTIFTTMDATNNPNLTCIEVQAPNNANAGLNNYATWQIDATASYSYNCADCIVAIPDANFKAYLVGNTNINTNGDTEIQCNEALNFNGAIDAINLGISDLTGIEAFPLLTYLSVNTNNLTNIDLSNNTALIEVSVLGNQLVELDVSNNPAITTLYCFSNNLSSLNLKNGHNSLLTTMNATDNPNLTCIEVDNPADAIAGNGSYGSWTVSSGVSYSQNCNECVVYIPDTNFKAYLLVDTNINTNGDTEIQCTEATSFTGTIWAMSQNIADLTGIEAFTSVTRIDCYNNQLTSLDVSQNTALEQLYCRYNQLTDLDVSQNPNLTAVVCNNNLLTSLNVKNGSNTAIIGADFNATNNPNLICIEVDNAADANAGNGNYAGWLKDAAAGYSEDCSACIVNIPDANFKAYLVGQPAINTNGDTEIQCSEANTFTGSITVLSLNVSDLTGIEAFTSLTGLTCSGNPLTSMDISNNTALTFLRCDNNNLTSLDVSNNPALTSVRCYNNNITSLDFSNNPLLTTIACFTNNLTSLNVTNNIALTELDCYNNNLSNLDVSNNSNLSSLYCSTNSLSTLDISNLTLLYTLDCSDNSITDLNLTYNTVLSSLVCYNNNLIDLDVSNNIYLQTIDCADNNITSLDFSLSNTVINRLYCYNNNLSSLNIKNGYGVFIMNATNNPDLYCIEVDNVAYATAPSTHWQIDTIASYSTDCNCTVTIPDANFKAYLIGEPTINTNGDSEIQCNEANNYTGEISVQSLNISDLTGIEAFTQITSLIVNTNNLTSLDVSNNTNLNTLSCNNNSLSTLDVSNLTLLTNLACSDNNITTLNLLNNTLLETLYCNNNNLSDLDTSNNPLLYEVDCYENNITALNFINNTVLELLNCDNNNLSDLDTSNNTLLHQVSCVFNNITSLDFSLNPAMVELICYNNNLSSLSIKNGNSNLINYLNATNNPGLYCVEVDDVAYATANTSWQIDAIASYSADCAATVCNITIPDANFKAYLVANPAINTNGDSEIQCNEASSFTGSIIVNNLNITDLTGIEEFVAITNLNCAYNTLTSLNLSNNTNLINLFCRNNALTSLDISNNTVLETINCRANAITSLDITNNLALTAIDCRANDLTALNLKNGNNTILTTMLAVNNPNLTCIEVDDATSATAGSGNYATWQKGASASYSEDCGLVYLTVNTVGNGVVNPQSGTYNLGETVSLTATPSIGWQFDGWSGNLSGNNSMESIVMNSNKTVTAHFSPIQVTLTGNIVGNGTLSVYPLPTNGTYDYGTVVNIIAIPDVGWEFSGWSGDLSGTTNPTTIQMDSNKTVTATFTQVQHTLAVNVIGNGSVNPNSGNYTYGDVISITATPDTGWEFYGWSGDASGNNNPLSVTMDADKTIMAIFTQIQHTLTVNVTGSGNVSPNSGTYNYGDAILITATPNTNWNFVQFNITNSSGTTQSTTNPLSITMNEDITIEAVFSTTNAVEDYTNTNIKLYPNPVNNTLYIDSDIFIQQIKIYNMMGQQILETKELNINVSNLKSGVYFIRLNTMNTKTIKQFIKK